MLGVHVHRDCISEASGRSDPRLTDLRCVTVSYLDDVRAYMVVIVS